MAVESCVAPRHFVPTVRAPGRPEPIARMARIDESTNRRSDMMTIDMNQDGQVDQTLIDANNDGVNDAGFHNPEMGYVGGEPTRDGAIGVLIEIAHEQGTTVWYDPNLETNS